MIRHRILRIYSYTTYYKVVHVSIVVSCTCTIDKVTCDDRNFVMCVLCGSEHAGRRHACVHSTQNSHAVAYRSA